MGGKTKTTFKKGMVKVPGSGRKKGTPNVAAFAIKQEALKAAPEAFKGLLRLTKGKRTPAAVKLAASMYILDRAFGKPEQRVEGEVALKITRIETTIVDPKKEIVEHVGPARISPPKPFVPNNGSSRSPD